MVETQGLVSIIIPNYNSENYIQDTIESILAQTYEQYEILIIDDCSTDQSVNIIKQYMKKDSRLSLFTLNTNSGRPAIPRNYGLTHAKGEYIAFMDSDDLWHREKLFFQLEYMNKTNSDFSCTDLKHFTNKNQILKDLGSSLSYDCSHRKLTHDQLLKKNIIPNSSVVIRKSSLGSTRFIEDIRYKAIEDYHTWLRLLAIGLNGIKINSKLLFYRKSDTSISKSKLDMIKKNYLLYSEYRHNNKKLGIKMYYLMISYFYYSAMQLFKKKLFTLLK